MAVDRDMLNNLKGGLGLASRLVGRSFDEVTKAIGKGEEGAEGGETGLYFVSGHPVMSARPRLTFLEPQLAQRFNINFLKGLTMSSSERAFIDSLRLILSGQHDEALRKLAEATGSARDAKVGLTDAFFTLGALRLHRGEFREAVSALKTGLLAQQGLGKTLVRYLPSFHVSVPLTPTSHFCLFPDLVGLNILLSCALFQEGETANALETLEGLLGLMPGEPNAVFFANLYRCALGKHRDVFSSLNTLLPDSNLQIACMVMLGQACAALDDPMTAREVFRKALERDGVDPVLRCDLRHSLASALEIEGWTEEARKELQTIHEEFPDYRPMFERFSVPQEISAPRPTAARALEEARRPEPEPAPEAQSPATPPAPARPIQTEPSGPLMLISSDGKKEIVLDRPVLTIGREEGDIVLGGDTAASRLHAQVTFEEGRVFVEDLGSTNGTWVNQHRVGRKVELHRGDWLQVGETSFQLR
jgi:tetratricopeptide (TPR) repeat protein